MKKYCVYWHKNKINGKLYIGMSGNIKLRWSRNGGTYRGCMYFYKAIQKYGWNNFEHEILYDNLTKEEAEELEIELILRYNTQNHENGYNISSGGKGISGVIRKSGKEHHFSKTVYQYDLDGNFICEWDSVSCASNELNISLPDICSVANSNKNLQMAGNYMWRYEFSDKIEPYKKRKYRNKPIYQIDEHFNILNKYQSVYETDRKQFKLDKIERCLTKDKLIYSGYYWCYVDEYDTFKDYVIQRKGNVNANKNKKVNQYDMYYNLIKTYCSTKEASKESEIPRGTIINYCCGQANYGFNTTGYYWRYAEDVVKS